MRHTTVAEVMSKAVVSVGPEDSFIDIAKLLYSATISAVPVIGPDGGLLGVVADADLLAKAAHRYAGEQPMGRGPHPTRAGHPRTPAGATTAAELMTSPVETVTPPDRHPRGGAADARRRPPMDAGDRRHGTRRRRRQPVRHAGGVPAR